MILWFAACAVLGAWSVLHDATFDYRLIAFGALLPDLVDAPLGHRGFTHTLIFAVGSLGVVMLATVNRRSLRRHVIALPIGFLAHLVLDAVWADKALFWWPGFGGWGGTPIVPSAPWFVVRELIGLVAALIIVRRFGLRAASARRELWRTGRLAPC